MRSLAVWSLLAIMAVGCADPQAPPTTAPIAVQGRCPDGVPDFELEVERRVTPVGPASNALVAAGDRLWIVESGANRVSRYQPATQRMEQGFIHVGGDRNPYAVDVDEDRGQVWIANFASSTISVADSNDGQILAEIADERLANPSAVALSADYAYISDVNFRSLAEGYGPGAIVVVDRRDFEVVSRWTTTYKNPHFIGIYEIDGAPQLLVSTSGAIEIGQEGVQVTSEGGLEWFDLGADPLAPPSQVYPLGQLARRTVGAAGQALLAPGGERLYFTSALAPVLFVFDIPSRQWVYDAQAPLALGESDGEATHMGAIGDDGLLWVSAFNEDAFYLFDTACDKLLAGPIDVGQVAHMLEGPQAIGLVAQPHGVDAYFLMSIANRMGRIGLEFKGDQP